MTAGVGLFGTFTIFVDSSFVEPQLRQEDDDITQLAGEVWALRARVQALEGRPLGGADGNFPARP